MARSGIPPDQTSPQKPEGRAKGAGKSATAKPRRRAGEPTQAQLSWLGRGMDQPGGKLPLFDLQGQRVKVRLVESCIKAGWAERWFNNPLKPNWLVCRLTDSGRTVLNARTNVIAIGLIAGQKKG